MLIVDSFKFDGKTAVYCVADTTDMDVNMKNVIIDNVKYKVIKRDIMTSLVGKTSVTLLLDTVNDISTNQEVLISH